MGLKKCEACVQASSIWSRWKGDIKHVALDITKLTVLGFKPKMNSTKAVERTAKYFV